MAKSTKHLDHSNLINQGINWLKKVIQPILEYFEEPEENKATPKKKLLIKKIFCATSTKKLGRIFKTKKIDEKTDGGDNSTGRGTFRVYDDFTTDFMKALTNEQVNHLLHVIESDPDRKRKFKKFVKKKAGDRFVKRIRRTLEKKDATKAHKIYQKELDKRIRKIIKASAKKIRRTLNKNEIRFAMTYFLTNSRRNLTPQQLSNIALIGVINASISGGLRNIIQANWEKIFSIKNYNQQPGFNLASQSSKYINNYVFTIEQPFEIDVKKIEAALKKGNLYPELIYLLEQEGYDFALTPEEKSQKDIKHKVRFS